MRVAILDDYAGLALRYADFARLGPDVTVDVFRDPLPSLEDAVQRLADYEVICLMRERTDFPAALIERLPRLKLIAMTGSKNRKLDIAAATRQGITVCTSPGSTQGTTNTAELAWGLLLAVARRIPSEEARLRSGAWQSDAGTTLNGRRLGLIGFGRVGQQFATYAHAFGMDILAWSPHLTQDRLAGHNGVQLATLDEILSTSDAISLHIVLGEATKNLIGEPEIARMKPGAMLINTSRAGLIDEPALLAALHAGRIRAGLDVFPIEPLPAQSPYHTLPNCVLTPHLGYVTEDTMASFYQGTLEVIEAYRRQAPIRVVDAA